MFSKNSDRNRLIHLGMDDAYGKHGLCPAFRFSDLFLELMFIEKALQAPTMSKQKLINIKALSSTIWVVYFQMKPNLASPLAHA